MFYFFLLLCYKNNKETFMALILAIDDDDVLLSMLKAQLENSEYSLVTAQNGNAGIQLAMTGHPDIILLDIIMPQMTGFDVLTQLRNSELTKNIAVIMLTAKSEKNDVMQAMNKGVIDYIVKPYKIDYLKNKIETALKYTQIKKNLLKDNLSKYITIARQNGRTIIEFLTKLSDKDLLAEAKTVYNRTFLNLTKNDLIIFDLRILSEFDLNDLAVLKTFITFFNQKECFIVAGRHFGLLMAEGDFPQNINIFISFGDMELYIIKGNY